MKAVRFASVQSIITVTLAILMGLAVAASMSGCATAMSKEEASAHEAASVAQAKRADADKAKSDAIATLAAGSGDSARVAGIMALVMSGQASAPQPQVIQSRRSTTEIVIDGFLRILGLGVQYHGIEAGKDVSIQASRDRAATDQAAFDALATVASHIQAPQANQSTTNQSTTNQTLSGTGVLGGGSYSAPVTTTETDLAWEASTTTTDTTSSTSSTSNSSDTNSSYNTQN